MSTADEEYAVGDIVEDLHSGRRWEIIRYYDGSSHLPIELEDHNRDRVEVSYLSLVELFSKVPKEEQDELQCVQPKQH